MMKPVDELRKNDVIVDGKFRYRVHRVDNVSHGRMGGLLVETTTGFQIGFGYKDAVEVA